MSLSHEHAGLKILAKIKIYILSREPNYFVQFEMRYPVLRYLNYVGLIKSKQGNNLN
jgi:hypothetical protein